MTTVTVERQLYPHGPFAFSSSYGQLEEFIKALPGIVGPLTELDSYTRTTGRLHTILEIENANGKTRYRIKGW